MRKQKDVTSLEQIDEEPDDDTNLGCFEEREYREMIVRRAAQVLRADFDEKTWQACWKFLALSEPAAKVAQDLDMTVNAVYLAKSRVLRRLRSELEGLV